MQTFLVYLTKIFDTLYPKKNSNKRNLRNFCEQLQKLAYVLISFFNRDQFFYLRSQMFCKCR